MFILLIYFLNIEKSVKRNYNISLINFNIIIELQSKLKDKIEEKDDDDDDDETTIIAIIINI